MRGTLSIMAAGEDLDRKFPFAKRMLGAHVVATIMAFSRLVGMSMPGLHSIPEAENLRIQTTEAIGQRLGGVFFNEPLGLNLFSI